MDRMALVQELISLRKEYWDKAQDATLQDTDWRVYQRMGQEVTVVIEGIFRDEWAKLGANTRER